jgi:putative membrane protein
MTHDSYFLGMHLVWWAVWLTVIFGVFALPYDIPGRRRKKYSPLELLENRYTAGEISIAEYNMRKEKISDLTHGLPYDGHHQLENPFN